MYVYIEAVFSIWFEIVMAYEEKSYVLPRDVRNCKLCLDKAMKVKDAVASLKTFNGRVHSKYAIDKFNIKGVRYEWINT